MNDAHEPEETRAYREQTEKLKFARRHARWGWTGLLVFATLGLGLELMLGLKIDFYLNVDSEVRRLVWRLAHAHGTLLSLLHVALAATVATLPGLRLGKGLRLASACLVSATIFLPGGFFAGGFGTYQSDPGVGILLAPLGAALLLLALALTTAAVGRS